MMAARRGTSDPLNPTQKRILEQLVGETGEPDRVLDAARALADRSLVSLRDGLNAELATPLEIELDAVAITRFADAKPAPVGCAAMTVAASQSSPDALVLVADANAVSLLLTALFGADTDQPVQPLTREPTATELDIVAMAFERFADVVNGSGDRSMTLNLPLPLPLAGKELERRVLRDGPAATIRFRLQSPGGAGVISMTMPQRVLLKHRGNESPDEGSKPVWRTRFGEEIMRSSVDLVATVALERMTLGEIANLQVGQVIALPEGAQSATRLSARGRPLYVCEFGKLGQNYTVRVSADYDAGKDFIDGLLPG
jgi:flagellar motor switch protein FliM